MISPCVFWPSFQGFKKWKKLNLFGLPITFKSLFGLPITFKSTLPLPDFLCIKMFCFPRGGNKCGGNWGKCVDEIRLFWPRANNLPNLFWRNGPNEIAECAHYRFATSFVKSGSVDCVLGPKFAYSVPRVFPSQYPQFLAFIPTPASPGRGLWGVFLSKLVPNLPDGVPTLPHHQPNQLTSHRSTVVGPNVLKEFAQPIWVVTIVLRMKGFKITLSYRLMFFKSFIFLFSPISSTGLPAPRHPRVSSLGCLFKYFSPINVKIATRISITIDVFQI